MIQDWELNKRSTILAVDDTPTNLRILAGVLSKHGYRVLTAHNGKTALEMIREHSPDLVLLDIMMPDMDGYEVCEKMKVSADSCDIPVIFISALSDVFDKVKAFTKGGVDYITKPFQMEEILVRVRTHLTIQDLQKNLMEKNDRLEKEIQEREKIEAALRQSETQLRDLNATKDKFFSIIAHDLKAPFGGLIPMLEMLLDTSLTIEADAYQKLLVDLRTSVGSAYRLLQNLLEWARFQQGQVSYEPMSFNLYHAAKTTLEVFQMVGKEKQIELMSDIEPELVVFGDGDMISTVIRNLVNNAIKFSHSEGTVSVTARVVDDQWVEIAVTDTGVGIKPENLEKLFRIDVNHKTRGTAGEKGTGLGLILCKEFVEKNGGRIWVESEVGKGSSFKFTVPKAQVEDD